MATFISCSAICIISFVACVTVHAAEISMGALPAEDQLAQAFGALAPDAQALAQQELDRMGAFDADRTFLSASGKFYIVDDAFLQPAEPGAAAEPEPGRRMVSSNGPSGYTSEGACMHAAVSCLCCLCILRGLSKVTAGCAQLVNHIQS